MRVIDLTHTISEDMPVYPGTEEPKLSVACTVKKDGFKETFLHIYSHTGTHIDAPAHMFENGTTLEHFGASQFVGSALVIDCSALGEGGRIDMSFIESCRENAEKAEFILFRTDWDRKWSTDAYFADFPCITGEVAYFIAATGKKGVGLDVISIDPINSMFENHRTLLRQDTIVIIENLCNLCEIGSEMFTFIAAPLKFESADGAPARAFALIN